MKIYSLVTNGATSSHYLEDLTLSFKQDLTTLAFNVTAIEQCGTNGSGPFYSVVGRSNTEYWYEVGVGWNWPSTLNPFSPSQGFQAIYDVLGTSGSLFSVHANLDHIGNGDIVLLKLSFSNNMVAMYVHDWNSSTTDRRSYSGFGATKFVGSSDSPVDSNGMFTGLATRQYHDTPYYGDEQSTVYRGSSSVSSAWMRIVEYPYPGNSPTVFDDYGSYDYSNPYLVQNFTSNGAFEASNAYQFVTGRLSTGPTCAASAATPSPLSSLAGYSYLIPLVIIGVVVLGLVLWLRRSTRWVVSPMPQPSPLSPGGFVDARGVVS